MHKPRPDPKSVTAPRLTGWPDDAVEQALLARVTTGCCIRCNGLLVPDTAVGDQEERWDDLDTVFRCVNCGEIVDALILRHRWSGISASTPRPRR